MLFKFRVLLAITVIISIFSAPLTTLPTFAAPVDHHQIQRIQRNGSTRHHGAAPDLALTEVDTLVLFGGPDNQQGDFEAGWNGWTSRDFTVAEAPDGGFWNVSDFNTESLGGSLAMWCGTYFGDDPGYGSNWNTSLEWSSYVLDPGVTATIRLTAALNYDVELNYDYVFFEVFRDGIWEQIEQYTGTRSGFAVDLSFDLTAGDEPLPVQLRWRVYSDSLYSDEDGSLDTDGAMQIDDITVDVDGLNISFDDFESEVGITWTEAVSMGVGDFAALYTNLQDIDACRSNYTTQVAFVDDGVVVPGTGGTPCVTWCFGPGGYIVNNSGGLLDPSYGINNGVISPPIAIPVEVDAVTTAFDVYHGPIFFGLDDPWMFYAVQIRSTASEDPEALDDAAWVGSPFLYHNTNGYTRWEESVDHMVESDARWMQVCLKVVEYMNFPNTGTDGVPTPYFDNVVVKGFARGGPGLTTLPTQLAQDSFPASGHLDFDDLAANSVRFDMAMNIADGEGANVPGDSLAIAVHPRGGATITSPPRMIVSMMPNPVFDAVRILPDDFAATPDGKVKGSVVGMQDESSSSWSFDLPDTGFIYPGDVIHYFFEAYDSRDGEVGLTRMPADTSGFDLFLGNQAMATVFPAAFEMRALPTVFSATPGDQPTILFWDDGGDEEAYQRWRFALADNGLLAGRDYDIYRTQAAAAGIGNGLGGRATAEQLDEYRTLFYTSGRQTDHTLGYGGVDTDPSRDIQLLEEWIDGGDRNLFLSGSGLALDLDWAEGGVGATFLDQTMGVQVIGGDVGQFIGNQTTPRIMAEPDSGILYLATEWVAHAGCPILPKMTAVVPTSDADRVAEFTDLNGNAGVYPYGAMVLKELSAVSGRVLSMPMSLEMVTNPPDWMPPSPLVYNVRSYLLGDVLYFFDWHQPMVPVAVPEVSAALTVHAYPNPFNPATAIHLSLGRDTEAQVAVYDLRGARVRMLHDGPLEAGEHTLRWGGDDDDGRGVASGLYFYQVQAAGETRLGKLTLLK